MEAKYYRWVGRFLVLGGLVLNYSGALAQGTCKSISTRNTKQLVRQEIRPVALKLKKTIADWGKDAQRLREKIQKSQENLLPSVEAAIQAFQANSNSFLPDGPFDEIFNFSFESYQAAQAVSLEQYPTAALSIATIDSYLNFSQMTGRFATRASGLGTGYQGDVQNLVNTVADYPTKRSTMVSLLGSYGSQRTTAVNRQSTLGGEISVVENQITNLNTQISTLESEIAVLQQSIDQLRTQRDRFQEQADILNVQITELEASNPDDLSLPLLRAAYQSIMTQIAGFNQQIAPLQQQVTSRQTQKTSLEQQRSTAQSELQDLQDEKELLDKVDVPFRSWQMAHMQGIIDASDAGNEISQVGILNLVSQMNLNLSIVSRMHQALQDTASQIGSLAQGMEAALQQLEALADQLPLDQLIALAGGVMTRDLAGVIGRTLTGTSYEVFNGLFGQVRSEFTRIMPRSGVLFAVERATSPNSARAKRSAGKSKASACAKKARQWLRFEKAFKRASKKLSRAAEAEALAASAQLLGGATIEDSLLGIKSSLFSAVK